MFILATTLFDGIWIIEGCVVKYEVIRVIFHTRTLNLPILRDAPHAVFSCDVDNLKSGFIFVYFMGNSCKLP